MKVSYRRLMAGLRFLLLFITCTLLSYGIITLLADKFLPANPYHEPHGNAVKVVKVINTSQAQDFDGYVARLQLFFLTGE
ncbi:YqzK family protein [Brevibacillus porteri]|uniref:YqzK family protein n=1 Tax=Brevibacillus porteri TaxID=2126350 RepID=UPI00370B1D4A